jgi:hypothetical protein
MRILPGAQRLGVLGAKEHAANSGYRHSCAPRHGNPQCGRQVNPAMSLADLWPERK